MKQKPTIYRFAKINHKGIIRNVIAAIHRIHQPSIRPNPGYQQAEALIGCFIRPCYFPS